MDAGAQQLQAFIDREAIRHCVAQLARGEDRRDADLLKASFWPDSRFDYGVYSGTFPDYLAWVVPGADAITNTQHVIGQSYIELDGDTAKVETHVISYHRVQMGEGEEAGERDTCIGGRYLDLFEKRDGAWRVADRTMLYDWFQDWGAAVDWSQGVMGYPFTDPKFPGTARADFSKVFFAK